MDSVTASKLLNLQELDNQIENINSELEKIPAEIEKLQKEIESLKIKHDQIIHRKKELELQKKEKELDIQTFQDRIAKLEIALNKIKSNEEYKALLREKAQAEENIIHLEDEILQLMEEIENLAKEIKEFERIKEEKIEELENEIKALNSKKTQLEEEINKLITQRQELIKTIKPQALSQYENIKKRVKNKVIAIIEDQVCTGCYMVIPPKIFTELLKSEKLFTCPNCGRYLFYESK